jgi:hypothetical protein
LIGIGGLALAFGFCLVLLRGEPSVANDQGVFLSVAARLLDGDRLYVDVIDNKDPLFYYTYAAALAVAGWRGPFLLDAIWLALAAISMPLLARELRAPRSAVVASFFLYPLALTAPWYLAGLSMLAALAFAPLAPWLWLRGRFAGAGVVVAIVMLFKLNIAPVCVAPIGALVVLGHPVRPGRREILRGALGLCGALLAAAAVLGVRGELRAYFDTVAYNVHYASALSDGSVHGRIHQHLLVVFDIFDRAGPWQLPVSLLVLGAFGIAVAVGWRRGTTPERALVGVATATLLGSAVVLALTAYWEHHLQLLAYPGTLVAVTLISVAAFACRRAGGVLAVAFVSFAFWTSLSEGGGLGLSSAWGTAPVSGGAVALERARKRFDPVSRDVTYMVLGTNHERAHAAFIGDEFDLVCRWFQLYPFSLPEQFDETLACAERKRPLFVLVTPGFVARRPDPRAWASFVARSKALLERHYELVEAPRPGVQVWRRTPSPT